MKNTNYHILNQLVQEQKSLWRIEAHYIEEATKDAEKKFWKKLKKQKEKNIEELSALAKKCL